MLNWIWLSFLLVAVVVGGFTGKLPDMTKGAFETAENAVMKIAFPLMGIWAIWLGMMRLAEASGLVQLLARLLRPLMRRLFPEVPPGHPAIGAMVLNMAANMLGLGNAATPLGLRAMAQLERLNPHPGVASNSMCTFLALNTASLQLIPTTAIGILAVAGSQNPTAIVPTAFIATAIAAVAGVTAAKTLENFPLFRPPATPARVIVDSTEAPAEELPPPPPMHLLGPAALACYLCLFPIFLAILVWPEAFNGFLATTFHSGHVPGLPPDLAGRPTFIRILSAISVLAVPFLLSFFPLYAACRGLPVYEQFVEGAKEAFGTAQRVIPYLVAMLVSISLLRTSGLLDLLMDGLRPLLSAVGFPADLLPMVLMRPLSGSGTQGLFVELVKNGGIGPDSFTARLAGTIYGSTETTFYVLAVYFGSIAIKQTRHAVAVGLIADTVAVIAAVMICHVMFG